MEELRASSTVVAVDDCLSTTVDGESVILNVASGTYYGFNTVGTCVWKRIQSPRSVEDVVQHVRQKYDVESQRCRDDVETLLIELAAKDLVRIDEE